MSDQKQSNPYGCLPLALFVALIVGLASYGMGHTGQEAAWHAATGGLVVVGVPIGLFLLGFGLLLLEALCDVWDGKR